MIEAERVTFLGFEVPDGVRARFQREFPDPQAGRNLDCWDRFGQEHPGTFIGRHKFRVQKSSSYSPHG